MHTIRAAINGFGRIGCAVLGAIKRRTDHSIKIVAINDSTIRSSSAACGDTYCCKPNASGKLISGDNKIVHSGDQIRSFNFISPPGSLWTNEGVELVFDCTGSFDSKRRLDAHLKAGARLVLSSQPIDDADHTIVVGINEETIKPEAQIISCSSCTGASLALLVKLLTQTIDIKCAIATSIHPLIESSQTTNFPAEGRGKCSNSKEFPVLPTTRMARILSELLPELPFSVHANSIRIPSPRIGLIDLSFYTHSPASIEKLHDSIIQASKTFMRGRIGLLDRNSPPIDAIGRPESALVFSSETSANGQCFFRLLWGHDNECAYAHRMVDVAIHSTKLLSSSQGAAHPAFV